MPTNGFDMAIQHATHPGATQILGLFNEGTMIMIHVRKKKDKNYASADQPRSHRLSHKQEASSWRSPEEAPGTSVLH